MNPYDNVVIEATNKILKTEFVYQREFETLEQLQLELTEYVYWYNDIKIHGSLVVFHQLHIGNKIQ